jgi:polar amino acid transport system permease protein
MSTLLATFDWTVIRENLPDLARGLERTMQIWVIGIGGSTVIGVALGAARANRIPIISQLATVYVEVIRNTPILVQIFFIFYGLPSVGYNLTPFTTAWLAVTIWGGAFNTENFRAGFEAVPFRFREAGLALGFTPLATFFQVTLPIGGRIALPSTINTYISVLKNTALLTAIGYPELTSVARSIAAVTFRDFEMITVLAVVYLTIVWTFSILIRMLEARLALPKEA